jgi:hypothetical protein
MRWNRRKPIMRRESSCRPKERNPICFLSLPSPDSKRQRYYAVL